MRRPVDIHSRQHFVCSTCCAFIGFPAGIPLPTEQSSDQCLNIRIFLALRNVRIGQEVRLARDGMTFVFVNCDTCNTQLAAEIIQGHPTIPMYRTGRFLFQQDRLLLWDGHQFCRFYD